MDPEPQPAKPKRHYTVTAKAREARLLSLAKARQAARRALRGYERGPHEDDVAHRARLHRQIRPWCANLRSASAARKADRSVTYATHFYHGLTAPDLDRSAAAAGESREELSRHIERCRRTNGGLAGLDDVEQTKSEIRNPKLENRNPKRETETRKTKLETRKAVLETRKSKLESLRISGFEFRFSGFGFRFSSGDQLLPKSVLPPFDARFGLTGKGLR